MAKFGKKLILNSRDKLFSNLTRSIDQLGKKVMALYESQETLVAQQADILAKINLEASRIRPTIIQTSPEEILVRIFSGAKIALDLKDISVTPHLALDGIWEPDTTYAWLQALDKKDTVIDIGANFGYYGLLAAQQTYAHKSKVIFFEANPKLIPYIHKTLSVNNYLEHSNIENLAVAEKKGTVELTILKDYIGSSSLHSIEHLDTYVGDKIHLEASETVKIQSTTIDDYCKLHKLPVVDLIKMDIEGYEDKAYQGMRKIIKASPRVTMFMEFTKNSYDNPKGFYEQLLKDFGTVYTVAADGSLVKPVATNFEALLGKLDDWTMLVFTKNIELAKNIHQS